MSSQAGDPNVMSTFQTVGMVIFGASLITLILTIYKVIYKWSTGTAQEQEKIDPKEWWKRMVTIILASVISFVIGAVLYGAATNPKLRRIGIGFLFAGITGGLYIVSSIAEAAFFSGETGRDALIGIDTARILIIMTMVIAGLAMMMSEVQTGKTLEIHM